MTTTLDRYTPPPSDDEYTQLVKMADGLARTQFVPTAFRNKPSDIVAASLYGREVGLSPMASLQRVVVINGKPTLDAQGMVAVIRSAGHSITGQSTAHKATAIGTRADNGDTMTVEWTIDMARQAGLVKRGPWTDYPSAMLWARAVTQLARMLFADVLAGFSYAPEELESVTHADELDVPRETSKTIKPVDVEIVDDQVTDADTGATIEPVGMADRIDDLDWDDVAREIAEAEGTQPDDDDVTQEIRKRKNLMRPVHAKLADVLNDDTEKDQLLRGYFQVGSWKLIPSDRLKAMLAAEEGNPGAIRSKLGDVPEAAA